MYKHTLTSTLSMSGLLQSFTTPTCTGRTVRRYSESVYQIARQKWQLDGIPRPKSILEDDDTPVDLSEDSDAVNGARSSSMLIKNHSRKPTPTEVSKHREAIRKSFPEGWSPPRKLSREAMDILRRLHHTDPESFSTPILAERFKISPEAVRRILKSKWEPSAERRTAKVVQERKHMDELRQKTKAERQSKKKLQSMNVEELRRLLKHDYFSREKYARPDGEDATQTIGIGATDKFTLR